MRKRKNQNKERFRRNFRKYLFQMLQINEMAKIHKVSRGTIHKWLKEIAPDYKHNKQRTKVILEGLRCEYDKYHIAAIARTTVTNVNRIIKPELDRRRKWKKDLSKAATKGIILEN
jgi:hypothetical protein